jgi:hypothetical protein
VVEGALKERNLIAKGVSPGDSEWLNSWSAVSATPENYDFRCRSYRPHTPYIDKYDSPNGLPY